MRERIQTLKHLTRAWPAVLVLVVLPWPAAAQNITTGSLTGVVRDAQGGVLPGATVVALHTPTGTSYEDVTRADGRFTLLNIRVGGPYSLTFTMPGFRAETVTDVNVSLGVSSEVPVTLQLESVTETIQVTAELSPLFNGSKSGTTATVDTAVIERLPSIARSLQDYARINPFVVQTASNSDPSALSIAGRSGRYNNIQIDGAVNNDLFGLADTGTPGGQADSQPIALDAIQELQIVVSPYDVRQGGFSGGGVNAITRSGSNAFNGTAYYYTRDQDLVGDGIDDRPIATFSDKQFGASAGGPVRQNRAFFFTNVEWGRKDTPSGFSVDGASGQSFGHQADAQRILEIARSLYGYDPGGLGEYIRKTNNNKFFIRGDVNLGSSQLVVRHNYVDAFSDIGTQSTGTYKFPDNFYRIDSETNSTVAQLNSSFRSMVNELRVSYQRIRDNRGGAGQRFPQVTIRLADGDRFVFGTEQFSTANRLDQDIVEIHNDLTIVRGNHQLTLGTHNELFSFSNLFIRDNFGSYEFSGIDTFAAGLAQRFDHSFSATANPRQAAEFSVNQLGFYGGDIWRVASNLTLTYGLRVDLALFPDKPTANAGVPPIYGFSTAEVPESQTWSPRVGFNYDLSTDTARQQVRGGLGLFGGRTPYVWLSNQYGNTGIEFTRLGVSYDASNRIAFVANPDAQPETLGSAFTNEIDLVDPDYSFPKLVRGNLAYDRDLGFGGLLGTVEMLFSTTTKDIDYQNLNLQQVGTRPDGRPVYGRLQPDFSDVILLTNTGEGQAWTVATAVERPFRDNWFARASYAYGESTSVNDGGSSQARSNWINVYHPGNPNQVPVATSNFDPGHRINVAASYMVPLGSRANVTLSAFYNGQSGRPYSYTFNNDVNADAGAFNDLLFIPNEDDVIIQNGSYADLLAFLDDGCTVTFGAINDRNGCRAPWTNQLDFRAAFEVPFSRSSAEITFDVLNLLNLFDSSAGIIEYATFNQLTPVRFDGVDEATGKYIYDIANVTSVLEGESDRYSRDDLRSRWQAQVGVRFKWGS